MSDLSPFFHQSLQTSVAVSERLTLTELGFCQILHHATPARVIISVPHDGMIASDFGLFHPRDKGPDGKRAVHGRDRYVWPIVNDIVQAAEARNMTVDAVRLLAPRLYIDGNRTLRSKDNPDRDTSHQTALDDERLKPLERNYRKAIRKLIKRSVRHHGKRNVFFIDCHGFGKQPDFAPEQGFDLILGTDNRATIRYGEPDRFFAREMSERGYQVFLPENQPVRPQGDPYSAGPTTINMSREHKVNAMQIEIAPRYRHSSDDTERGQRLARDIVDFIYRHYTFG